MGVSRGDRVRIACSAPAGDAIQFRAPKLGKTIRGTVVDVGRDRTAVDFNLPYAGKPLNFEVKLLAKA